MKLVNVIVVTLGIDNHLKNTINSIDEQTYSNIRIIVKDGATESEGLPSSDNLLYINKSDNSIYDAMNQALDMVAEGLVIFMNSGDCFYNKNVLQQMVKSYEQAGIDSIVYGDIYHRLKQIKEPQARKLNKLYLFRTNLCHQSILCNVDHFRLLGNFNTNYKISADREFVYKLYFSGVKFIHSNCIVVNYEGGGFSENNRRLLISEVNKIRSCYYSRNYILMHKLLNFISFPPLRKKLEKYHITSKSYKKIKDILSKFC